MIPATISAALTSLQVNAQAAAPLKQAPPLVKAGLAQQGAALLALIDGAIPASIGALDGADPSGFAGDLVNDLLALDEAAGDQATLVDIRGTVGRAVFNLDQVIVQPVSSSSAGPASGRIGEMVIGLGKIGVA